jgi:hypothetical protein
MRSLPHSRNSIPVPQFKAPAKLGELLEVRFSQSFQYTGAVRPATWHEDNFVCQADPVCDV